MAKNCIYIGENNSGKTSLLFSEFTDSMLKTKESLFDYITNEKRYIKNYSFPSILTIERALIKSEIYNKTDFNKYDHDYSLSYFYYDDNEISLITLKERNSKNLREVLEFLFSNLNIYLAYPISTILCDLFPDNFSNIDESIKEIIFQLNKENGKFNLSLISNLSDGIKSTIVVLATILYEQYFLPDLIKKKYKNIKIIRKIYIDEFENYLSPHCQISLLNKIKKLFPDLNLVLSTHSPLTIASFRNINIDIKRVENGKIKKIKKDNFSYKNIDYILHRMFAFTFFEEEVSELYRVFDELLDSLSNNDPNSKQFIKRYDVLKDFYYDEIPQHMYKAHSDLFEIFDNKISEFQSK